MMLLGVLLWHRVRRDRLQLIIWILGIGLLALFSTSSIQNTFGDSASRATVLRLAVANPSILLLRGTPAGAGLNTFVFFEIFTFLALLAGLMNSFLAVRHTRAEEEFGRAELIGSTPAARTTPTVATIVYGILVNLVLGLVVALCFTAGTADAAGSFVAGLATAGTGIAFLGVGLLAAQFMRTSRGANGVAASAVTAAYLFRGIGDALGAPSADGLHVTPAWWSWLSPIGWGQRTQAYGANTLLPLLFDLALAATSIAIVFVLQAHRDSGASLLPGRAGRATARRTLSGSLGLAWRLQWPTIIGWCVGGALFGLLAGVLSKAVSEAVGVDATLRRTIASLVPGGHGTLAQIFISAIFVMVGVIAAACAIQVVMRMRQEEVAGTAELILATRVSRLRWLVDYFVVGTAAIVLVLVSGAVASGLSSVASGESAARIGDSFQAAAAQLPAALVYLAVLALVFGILPAWTIGLGWALLGIGTFFGVFGGLIGLPDWARNISPFTHSPVPIGTSTNWSGGVWMLGIAVVAGILASVAVRRRELGTA
ncbi:MAG: polyether ionophore transport system permease protein [Microbacteriaceae bacterium]|jgi:ABC-2 type transport system permease protein|nr:polyether ionophore transport system permease protein [Microbacteriaceae bacterium]